MIFAWPLYAGLLLLLKASSPDLWFFAELPLPFFWFLLCLSCLPLLGLHPGLHERLLRLQGRLDQQSITLPVVWIMIASLGGGFCLYIFRLQLFLPPPTGAGDSLHLIEHIPVYTELFGFLDSFDEPLELFLRSKLYLFFQRLGFEVDIAYATVSASAGSLYFILVFFFFRERSALAHLWALPFFLLSPLLAHFAGYVESYTLVQVPMLAATLLGWQALKKRKADWLPAVAALAALAFLLHGIAGFLLPALIYLTFALRGSGPLWRSILAPLLAALCVLLPAYLYFLWLAEHPVELRGSFALRPPLLAPFELLTPTMLVGKMQALLAAAPLALPALAYFAPGLWQGLRQGKSESIFLSLAVLSYFGHFWIWNPMIGFPADRDLFSLFALPLSVLLYSLFYPSTDTDQPAYTRTNPAQPEESSRDAALGRRANSYGLKGRPLLLLWPLILTLQAGFLYSWVSHNHRPAPGPDLRAQAIQRGREFVALTRSNPSFQSLPNSRSQKLWVKAHLFAERMQSEYPCCKHLPALNLELGNLRTALAGEPAQEKAVHAAWQALTRINIEISSDCQSGAKPTACPPESKGQ